MELMELMPMMEELAASLSGIDDITAIMMLGILLAVIFSAASLSYAVSIKKSLSHNRSGTVRKSSEDEEDGDEEFYREVEPDEDKTSFIGSIMRKPAKVHPIAGFKPKSGNGKVKPKAADQAVSDPLDPFAKKKGKSKEQPFPVG